jgi:prefoldin subunit 5
VSQDFASFMKENDATMSKLAEEYQCLQRQLGEIENQLWQIQQMIRED